MAFNALTVQRYWNAATNDLGLRAGFGVNGDAYLVTMAGAADIGQSGSWNVGDIAFFVLDRWVRIPVSLLSLGVGVANVAAMTALTDRPSLVVTAGEVTPQDGKGAMFFWNLGSTTTADGVSVINPPIGAAGRYKRIDQQMHLLNAGVLSDDGAGGFVQDNGGINVGGPTGVWVKQEGFIADHEEGSLAIYPRVVNRWGGLSINPSGKPWDLPNENITSLGLQLLTGAGGEERLVDTAKWFGNQATGIGEYRRAVIQSGAGRYWPMTFSNSDVRLMAINPDKTVVFTNENFDYTSGGNTVVEFKNPGTLNKFRAIARPTDGVVGFERLANNVLQYTIILNNLDVTIDANIRLSTVNPALWLTQTNGLLDQKKWFLDVSAGALRGLLANDAETAFSTWLSVYRSGTSITAIDLAPVIGTIGALPAGANDAAAAAAGVRIGGFYQNAGALRQRLV